MFGTVLIERNSGVSIDLTAIVRAQKTLRFLCHFLGTNDGAGHFLWFFYRSRLDSDASAFGSSSETTIEWLLISYHQEVVN